VLSSQIEGTQSSLSDLLLFELDEAPGVPLDDVREVFNYVAALEVGLQRIKEGLPISSRLIREMHGALLRDGRGAGKQPGEFRRTQNWIGGRTPTDAVYVPPPWSHIAACIADLERFIHNQPEQTSTLVKAALAHVQFETIHPFLDGNGRIGRLLITLLLTSEGVLSEPLLYLSLYFNRNRQRYYELLDKVRREGDWEEWLAFFADAVNTTAMGAVDTARQLGALFKSDRERIQALGREAGSALQIHEALQARPLRNVSGMQNATHRSPPTILKALDILVKLGIVREVTGRRRNRVFEYRRYMELLNRDV
ncbi:MAG: Fic family protein, partial [Gammaproteobacteria bacterium]